MSDNRSLMQRPYRVKKNDGPKPLKKRMLEVPGLFPDRAIALKIKALFFFDKIKK
ncbi:MAG: hypothetical protein MGG11_03665 [Trichodesmium sp. MAG_R03]|nr:hypothetical protein [Trichodesmium sp. MAG_R03]